MAGDKQIQSVTPIYERVKKEECEEDKKPEALAVAVRKRKFESDEKKEEAGETVMEKG